MKFLPEFEFNGEGKVVSVSLPWGFIIVLILICIR
jgi:hypothetical protein